MLTRGIPPSPTIELFDWLGFDVYSPFFPSSTSYFQDEVTYLYGHLEPTSSLY